MWLRFKAYLSVGSIFVLINHVNCQEALVEISQGTLRGRTATNRDGGSFYSFQNIPYAKPPVNELRFKAPVATDGWDDIRDATEDLPSCSQFDSQLQLVIGQEDCLYLNVFTPQLPTEDSKKKPVMLFFYGGGFVGGSAQTILFGPEFLLTKDIVLVTVNYRVGIFGFLNLNDSELEVPGNAGMKDQVMALQWLKDNIEKFGGDPDNVTIFGESAGSISVHLHILSKMSTGLFHRGISQSSVALTPVFLNSVRNNGELVAQQLGIQTDNWKEMLASLREASPEDLVTGTMAASGLFANGEFTEPIVEEPSNEPTFLSNNPIDIIRSGDYNHVPFLVGSNDAEGLALQMASLQSTGENLLIEDFTYFVPNEFGLAPGSEMEATAIRKIKEFYYGDTEPNRDDITPAVNLYTDCFFAFPAYRTVVEHLKTLSAPIYLYIFSADTALNREKRTDPRLLEFPGASHGDELGYMFQSVFTPPTLEEGGVEDLAWRNMVNLWTNFAISGEPTPDDSNGFVWQPVNETVFNFLQIATNITYSDVDPNPASMKFWSDLYEEFYPNN